MGWLWQLGPGGACGVLSTRRHGAKQAARVARFFVRQLWLLLVTGFCLLPLSASAQTEPAVSEPPADVAKDPTATLPQVEVAAAVPTSNKPALPTSGLQSNAAAETPEQSVVVVSVNQRRVALGIVLDSGEILTSLSALGRGRGVFGRYADGNRAPLAVVRSHRGYDLALLKPVTGGRTGIPVASTGAQIASVLRWRRGAKAPKKQLFVAVKEVTALGADSVPLPGSRLGRQRYELGTPLVSDLGHLVGLVVAACVPRQETQKDWGLTRGCRDGRVVLDAALIAKFVEPVPQPSEKMSGWLGIKGEAADAGWVRGVRIVGFEPDSPAQQAGLIGANVAYAGDLLVAVDGIPIASTQRLQRVIASHVPGTQLQLLVLRGERFETVSVMLAGRVATGGGWELRPPLIQPPNPWLGY